MKTLFFKALFTFFVAFSLVILPMDSMAHHGGGGGGGGWGYGAAFLGGMLLTAPAYNSYNAGYDEPPPGYYGPPPGYYHRHCAWVRGFYDEYGYWVPSRRECW